MGILEIRKFANPGNSGNPRDSKIRKSWKFWKSWKSWKIWKSWKFWKILEIENREIPKLTDPVRIQSGRSLTKTVNPRKLARVNCRHGFRRNFQSGHRRFKSRNNVRGSGSPRGREAREVGRIRPTAADLHARRARRRRMPVRTPRRASRPARGSAMSKQ